MVRIRLRRTGLKNQATYRIMAADKECPRDGRFLEILGDYNPRTHPATIRVREDRVFEWLQKGAQPSDSALQVFNSIGLMDRYARFKAGEPIEKLLEEAKAASSRKSAEPAPVKGISKKAAAKAKEGAKAKEDTVAKAEEIKPVKEEIPAEKAVEEVAESKAEEPVEEKEDKEQPAEEEKPGDKDQEESEPAGKEQEESKPAE